MQGPDGGRCPRRRIFLDLHVYYVRACFLAPSVLMAFLCPSIVSDRTLKLENLKTQDSRRKSQERERDEALRCQPLNQAFEGCWVLTAGWCGVRCACFNCLPRRDEDIHSRLRA